MMGRAARQMRRRRRAVWNQVVVFEPDPTDSYEAMLVAARAAGCTCAPYVYMSDLEREAAVYHDSWCALLRRGDMN